MRWAFLTVSACRVCCLGTWVSSSILVNDIAVMSCHSIVEHSSRNPRLMFVCLLPLPSYLHVVSVASLLSPKLKGPSYCVGSLLCYRPSRAGSWRVNTTSAPAFTLRANKPHTRLAHLEILVYLFRLLSVTPFFYSVCKTSSHTHTSLLH